MKTVVAFILVTALSVSSAFAGQTHVKPSGHNPYSADVVGTTGSNSAATDYTVDGHAISAPAGR